ncbi:hypothetical protein HK102_011383 [Quaeritorhiza haematococci]|nr:hypothetical protein HK102_011383 [Quaeritorhiza haematococci]
MEVLSFLLPPPPADWDVDRDYRVFKKFSDCIVQPVEPAGQAFVGLIRRKRHKRTLSEDEQIEAALASANEEDVSAQEEEEETWELLQSDPLQWKEQDHYAILGISKLRWNATDDDIKRAYRRKVLKHHPDKKASTTGSTNDDSFFKCIQKAWEVLGDPVKRRQWDSVDPTFDESIPSAKLKGDFFAVYGPVFESEARFSKVTPVLPLGTAESSKEEVEAFYDFWYNFDSWRSFEAYDEEDPENAESRDEKRFLERRNKAARAKRKKEDNSRIARLVEQALKNDPRIAKFKEQEKAAKEAKKRERELAARAVEEEAKRKAEEEQLAREKAEAEEKQRLDIERKEREQKKKAIRKEKKVIKNLVKDHHYFLAAGAKATPTDIESELSKLDEILDNLDPDQLEKFRLDLESTSDAKKRKAIYDEKHTEVCAELTKRQREAEEAQRQKERESAAAIESANAKKAKAPWTPKEVAILIKAVKLFPGGTVNRWDKISEYVNQHANEDEEETDKRRPDRTPDECIKMSKQVQQGAAATDRTRLQLTAQKKVVQVDIKDAPTQRYSASASAESQANGASSTDNTATAWTPAQQAALESALRKYPASAFSANPAERWDKIAGEVEGRTKKEIKLRVKELAEMIKKKKQASK